MVLLISAGSNWQSTCQIYLFDIKSPILKICVPNVIYVFLRSK